MAMFLSNLAEAPRAFIGYLSMAMIYILNHGGTHARTYTYTNAW